MAERKSVNKYYPPDWDPSKGSVNKYVGQHPLRDRARKLGQGILIIRFEMPYNIWCDGCGNHIGMGVRYNAEKKKSGNYYSTPIYTFRMKCHLCDNHFEIQTDPKNHDYVILNGARRKEQRWDPKDNEQIVPDDKATQKKLATDAMYKLEHGSDDQKRGKAAVLSVGQIEGKRSGWKDDYILNKIARSKFREEKKAIKSAEESDKALLLKSSLDIPLVKEKEADIRLAGLMKYRALESYEERQQKKRKEIESRPIFQQPSRKQARLDTPNKQSSSDPKYGIIKRLELPSGKKNSPFDTGAFTHGMTTPSKNSLNIKGIVKPKSLSDSKCLNSRFVGGNDDSEETEVSSICESPKEVDISTDRDVDRHQTCEQSVIGYGLAVSEVEEETYRNLPVQGTCDDTQNSVDVQRQDSINSDDQMKPCDAGPNDDSGKDRTEDKTSQADTHSNVSCLDGLKTDVNRVERVLKSNGLTLISPDRTVSGLGLVSNYSGSESDSDSKSEL